VISKAIASTPISSVRVEYLNGVLVLDSVGDRAVATSDHTLVRKAKPLKLTNRRAEEEGLN